MGLGVAASAYAIYVAVAVWESVAQLHRVDTALASRAPRATASPRPARVEPTATEPRRPDAAPQTRRDADAVPDADDEVIARAPGAPAASAPDAPGEDSNILRQRALLDVAALPEFADLLDSQDPEVRKAVLDFFEDE